MTVLNWSEFPAGPNGRVDQCSECAYLAGLSWGGATFPLGEYTQATRDALTRAEVDREASRAAGLPMFPLIDAASQRLFGVRLRQVSGSSAPRDRASLSQLRAALVPGNLLVVAGNFGDYYNGGGLPPDHPLRARARAANGSDYAGRGKGHMLAFPVLYDGAIGALDPLQKWRTPPYVWTTDREQAIADVIRFAYAARDAHVVALDEFAGVLPDTALPQEEDMTWREYATPIGPTELVLREGTIPYAGPGREFGEHSVGYVHPAHDRVVSVLKVDLPDNAGTWYGCVRRLGDRGLFWEPKSGVESATPFAADCGPQITAATQALSNKLAAARTAVAGAKQAIDSADRSLA